MLIYTHSTRPPSESYRILPMRARIGAYERAVVLIIISVRRLRKECAQLCPTVLLCKPSHHPVVSKPITFVIDVLPFVRAAEAFVMDLSLGVVFYILADFVGEPDEEVMMRKTTARGDIRLAMLSDTEGTCIRAP